jgi:hypothetical protein
MGLTRYSGHDRRILGSRRSSLKEKNANDIECGDVRIPENPFDQIQLS